MKANELRIGNIIKWDDESQDFVTVIGIDTKDNSTAIATNQNELAEIEEFEPILLTEEWLMNFGFTKGTDLWGERAEYEYLFSEGKGVTVSDTNEIYMGCFSQTLQYVHQLQNLIFAMSGVELQLSST